METRRIRRLERRRLHRTIALAAAIATSGVAIGMTLPSNAPASIALFTAAVACVAIVATRAEAVAPMHGLHRVVRLPFRRSLATTVASFAARVVGSVHALLPRRLELTPIVLDEADDEAEAWWGASSAPTPAAVVDAPPIQSGLPLTPVLAAAITSARFPATDADSVPRWVERIRGGVRRQLATLARRMEPTEEAGAST